MNPKIDRVVLIRHATSAANLDSTLYRSMPDHTIPLARPGDDPIALIAGDKIASLNIRTELLCSWCSTYLRCHQTEDLVLQRAFPTQYETINRRISFLLREQEFGDWDGLTEEQMAAREPERFERRRRLSDALGRFYFRYPNGESRADVTQRISILLGKIHRSRYTQHLIFLHGVTQRAFRMAWFNRDPEWFETEPNPANASVLEITREGGNRWQERYLLDPATAGG